MLATILTEVVYGLSPGERERVATLLAEGRFFWLDVVAGEASREDVTDALRLSDEAAHALYGSPEGYGSRKYYAGDDALVFGLRCYIEPRTAADGDDYRLQPVDVRVVVAADYLLTLHEARVLLPADLAPAIAEEEHKRDVVYALLEATIASSLDALEEVELILEDYAQRAVNAGGGPKARAALRRVGARLATMRRWMTAERAICQRIDPELDDLRGFERGDEPPFEHLAGECQHVLNSIDAAASALGTLLDLQLNERAYAVSVVATIFVPLTFITGFFGMNFGWMVDHIKSPAAFFGLAILLPLVAGAIAWRLGVRRFLIGDDQSQRRR